jgi:hypothetical protein
MQVTKTSRQQTTKGETMTKYTLTENAVAYFIEYAKGKVEAFDTIEARDEAIAEIAADDAAWAAA